MRRKLSNCLAALLVLMMLCGSAFAQGEKKTAYALLIDNTGSLRSQLPDVLLISKGIVEKTCERGPVSLFNFQTQGDQRSPLAVISPGVEWSQDRARLNNYIDNLRITPGQTTLMDAIDAIARQLNAKVNAEKDGFGEKVIFLVTDGEERQSRINEKQLIKTLKESGLKVYAVGLVKELEKEGGIIHKAPREKAVAFLEKITKETGGRAVISKAKKMDVDRLLAELFAE